MTTDTASVVRRVEIDRLVAGGEGLARVDGEVVFVPGVAAGDVLDVRIVERRRGFSRATPGELITAGPGRRQPPCPIAWQCGGCDWQHLDYDAQIEAKCSILDQSFRRTARLELPPVAVHRSPELGYRRRARLHIDRRDGQAPVVGFRGRRSHDVVALTACPVLTPALQAVLVELPRQVAASERRSVQVLDAGDGVVVEGIDSTARITVGNVTLETAPDAFFQANQPLVQPLRERVIAHAGNGRVAWELYAGVGLFTTGLGAQFASVIAVEGDPRSAELLRQNLHQAPHVEVISGSVEAAWMKLLHGSPADVIVVDPPRDGLSAEVCRQVIRHRPARLVYVSCDPVTLARDVGRMVTAGFELKAVDLFDLFPQTHHFETVALLNGSATPIG